MVEEFPSCVREIFDTSRQDSARTSGLLTNTVLPVGRIDREHGDVPRVRVILDFLFCLANDGAHRSIAYLRLSSASDKKSGPVLPVPFLSAVNWL